MGLVLCAHRATAEAWPLFDSRPTDRHPTSQVRFEGDEVRLVAQASADSFDETIYEWWKNGAPIPRSNRSSLILSNLNRADSGIYYATARNRFGLAVSKEARIEVVGRAPLPGRMDPGFFGVTAIDNDDEIRSIAIDEKGRVLVVGKFAGYGLSKANNIVRLLSDGAVDPEFNPGVGANDTIRCVAVVGDSVWIGGDFTEFDGVSCQHLLRLDANGTIAPAFQAMTGLDSDVRSILADEDGAVLIGGTFRSVGNQATGNLARIDRNGRLDPEFDPAIHDTVEDMARDAVGRIVIVGSFVAGDYSRIARLHSNGSIDTTFFRGTGSTRPVFDVALQSDGAILIGGLFARVHGVPRARLARLRPDGDLDFSFRVDPDDDVEDLAVDAQDRTVVCGGFDRINGKSCPRIARVLPTGEIDSSFVAPQWDGEVKALKITSTGNVLVGGEFDDIPQRYVLRLFGDVPVYPPGTMLYQPQNWMTSEHGVARFSVVTAPTVGARFQWFFEDAPIDGEEMAEFEIFDVNLSHMGEYHCEVTVDGMQLESDRAELTVLTRRLGEPIIYHIKGEQSVVGADWVPSNRAVLESSLEITEDILIEDVDVTFTLEHGDTSLLSVELEFDPSYAGAVENVPLFVRQSPGGFGFYRTTIDDDSNIRLSDGALAPYTGSFAPLRGLGSFNQRSAKGTWRLKVFDRLEDELAAKLVTWELKLTEKLAEPSYDSWAKNYFASDSPPPATADSDGDGVINFLDFISGRERMQPFPVTVDQKGAHFRLHKGSSPLFETSQDLSQWRAVTPFVTERPGLFQNVQLSSSLAGSFFRLRAN